VVFAKDQQQHSVADLPVELVNKARTEYHLLVMPLAALSSSQHAASMLSIEFKREVDAKGAHDALRQLQRQCGWAGIRFDFANKTVRLADKFVERLKKPVGSYTLSALESWMGKLLYATAILGLPGPRQR
jgi:hypothetical protein